MNKSYETMGRDNNDENNERRQILIKKKKRRMRKRDGEIEKEKRETWNEKRDFTLAGLNDDEFSPSSNRGSITPISIIPGHVPLIPIEPIERLSRPAGGHLRPSFAPA